MPTTATGLFFVGKGSAARPATSTHKDPERGFILKMRVVDNQGQHAIEPWVVRWIGPEAEAWWRAHAELKAGDALSLELINPRAFPGVRTTEIHAQVRACRLLPPRGANTQQQLAAQAT